jgi:hypothetical protein
MGLLIQSSFTTLEGLPVSSIYCKLVTFIYDIAKTGLTLTLKVDTYISREAGHSGYRPITVPNFPVQLTIPGAEVQSLEYVYTLLKLKLEDLGYTVENVLEDGQTLILENVTLPVLPPAPVSDTPLNQFGENIIISLPPAPAEGEVSQQSS